ncbi:hypothetical protein [Streptomyces sp. A0958]|uniref:hypothetical protein n=1 Tax=Streptomyces sp. A0958 TaxID=2563101 RepID=UPI001447BA9D|nr:hypothetical protein [Streptomyces sp. A0958]
MPSPYPPVKPVDCTHPKVVHHNHGVSTHCFRKATANDAPRRTTSASGTTPPWPKALPADVPFNPES